LVKGLAERVNLLANLICIEVVSPRADSAGLVEEGLAEGVETSRVIDIAPSIIQLESGVAAEAVAVALVEALAKRICHCAIFIDVEVVPPRAPHADGVIELRTASGQATGSRHLAISSS
jgi:hypothetical protein